ncbi:MAG: FG-GAP repeat protein [Deltaproteobacteria bacterium]|nr:FG-GAP repeat protein [Deltaproteobacteria bacterium]
MTAGDEAGASLALTDWNSDEVVDLIIGAPGVDTLSGSAGKDSGAVYIVLGPITQSTTVSASATTTTRAGLTDARFGEQVSHIGDLDGDGRPELAFASPSYDYSGIGESEVFILEPDEGTEDLSSAPYWHLKGGGTSARLGLEMCGAGDVNLDGYADLLIANPANSGDKGVVYLISGSSVQLKGGGGGSYDYATEALTKLSGSQSGEGLGSALACPGDVNGDGHAEVALGSPGHDMRSSSPTYDYGAVFVWFGPTPSGSLAPEDADSSLSTIDTEAGLGAVLGTGGDVNGLGWIDLAASAGGGEDLVIWMNDRF